MDGELDDLSATWNKAVVGAARRASAEAGASPEWAERAVDAFVSFTVPTAPEPTTGIVTAGPAGAGGGTSRKAGNIVLDWRHLWEVALDAAAAVGAPAVSPWALLFVGLKICTTLLRASEESLGEAEASTMYALWKYRDGHDRILEEDGFARTNAVRGLHGMPALSRTQYVAAVDRLLKLKCVELHEGVISLVEQVRIPY
jgi:hypothetical protein